MDPAHIVVRVAFGYLWVRALVRLSGKRAVKHGDISTFVVALIIGDMFDDLFWAEVSVPQFITGVSALIVVHLWMTSGRLRASSRDWRRATRTSAGR
jgi:uncharacterized membrane protein YcaP (DUF421 family)